MSAADVSAYDAAGQVEWVSPEMREWFVANTSSIAATASAPGTQPAKAAGGLKALPTWAKVVGVLLLLGALSSCCSMLNRAEPAAEVEQEAPEPASSATPDEEPSAEPVEKAEPGKQPYTAEEREYASAVVSLNMTLAEALTNLGTVLSTDPVGVMMGGDSMIEAAGYSAVIQLTYQEAQKLSPPPSMLAVHEKWLASLKDYNDSMDLLAHAIDTQNIEEMEQATALLQSGAVKTQEAAMLLQEFQSTRQ